ncbi:MAG: PDZ domain-containing protein, partial [Clostridia bacterium]|nr:PDZ domain-containing protein [Clostridia bacterium]
MNKKIRVDVTVFLIVAAIIISCLATTFIINTKIGNLTEVQAAFSKIKNIDDLVNEHYIGAIDSETLANAIAKGYIAGLGDTYAAYYSKEEYRAYQAQITGQYEGIGLTVVWVDNVGLEVTHVSKGSPAETAGVKIGDIITMVDNTSVLTLGHDDAVSKLTGTVGTVANFTVSRNGEMQVFSVMRSQYEQVTVEYKKLGTIGYVKITGFNNLTGDYFGQAIDDLETQGVSGFIFDVRNNPGGTIDAVVECV